MINYETNYFIIKSKLVRKLDKFKNSSIENNNLYYYTLNGLLFAIVFELYKTYAAKFIFRLGGSEAHVALYNALPGLIAVITTLPGIIFITNLKNKKSSICKAFFSSRIFLLFFAGVPFLPTSIRPLTFVILISLMNFPESVSVSASQSYLGDIFTKDRIPDALAYKSKYSTIVKICFTFIVGQTLGIASKYATNGQVIVLYQILFVVAFLIGLLEIKSFTKLQEINDPIKIKTNIKEVFSEIISYKPFIKFLICSTLFHFGWQMGWPIFSIYEIQHLGADENWLTAINTVSAIVMIIGANFWKKIIHKKGNSFAMTIVTLGMSFSPFLYAFSPNLFLVTIVAGISGFFIPGTYSVLINSLIEVTPQKNRDIFMGVHATVTSITLCISPLVANYFLEKTNIIFTLLIVAAFRFVGSLAFFIRNK